MKYLVLLVVLVVAYMMWRNARIERGSGGGEARGPGGTPGLPQEMVSCPVCDLHLPKSEAVAGSDGRLYCTHEHRRRAGA
jgi:uncharacterized protein